MLCTCFIIADFNRPTEYTCLFLLPLIFAMCSIVFCPIYELIPKNLGATLIIVLFFVRMVISPLFMSLGNYTVSISKGVEYNTILAIFLVCYENLAVFFTLFFLQQKSSLNDKLLDSTTIKTESMQHRQKIKRQYKFLLIGVLMVLCFCIAYTPALMKTYRTVFQIGDKFFTNYEDALITEQYGTSFVAKLSLVTGQYLMRASIILYPSIIIISCANTNKKFLKWVALCFTTVPLFFIGGTIARSLIYCVVLLLLWNLLYNRHKMNQKIIKLFSIASFVVIGWWIFRSSVSSLERFVIDIDSFSERFSSYFSGVNIVSGSFNLERTLDLRFRYFAYDFLSTFPYGNTLFGISHETVQPFFNAMNSSSGQIPTTIGMGYYYFGFVLSPIYSIVFAIISFNAANQLIHRTTNPIKYVRLLLTVFQFGMGIIMYNIEITMTNYWTLILPLYLMERFAYIRDDTSSVTL